MRDQTIKAASFSFYAEGANNHIFISSDEATILRQRKIFALPGLTESLKGDGYETENAARTAYLLSALNTEDLPVRLVSAKCIPNTVRHKAFPVDVSECSTGGTLEMPKISHCDAHLSFANLLRVSLMAFDRHSTFIFDIHIKGNAVLTKDNKLYILDPNASFALPPTGRRPSIGSRSNVSFPFSYQSGCDDARDMVCWLWCLMGRHLFAHLGKNSYVVIPSLMLEGADIQGKKLAKPSESDLACMESLLDNMRQTLKERTVLLWQLLCEAISKIIDACYPICICFSENLCSMFCEAHHSQGLYPTQSLSESPIDVQRKAVNKNPYYLQYTSKEVKLYYMTQKPAYVIYNHFVEDDALRECSHQVRCRYMAILRRSLRSYARKINMSQAERLRLSRDVELSQLTALMLYVVIRSSEPSMWWWCFGFCKAKKCRTALARISQFTPEDRAIAQNQLSSLSTVISEDYNRISKQYNVDGTVLDRRVASQSRLGRLCSTVKAVDMVT